jgi:hypothetical protein
MNATRNEKAESTRALNWSEQRFEEYLTDCDVHKLAKIGHVVYGLYRHLQGVPENAFLSAAPLVDPDEYLPYGMDSVEDLNAEFEKFRQYLYEFSESFGFVIDQLHEAYDREHKRLSNCCAEQSASSPTEPVTAT